MLVLFNFKEETFLFCFCVTFKDLVTEHRSLR